MLDETREVEERRDVKETVVTRNLSEGTETRTVRETREVKSLRPVAFDNGKSNRAQRSNALENDARSHRFIRGVSHVNIGVSNLEVAVEFYQRLFDATPLRTFENFRNAGFSKSAGFLDNPDEVEVSIAFLEIPEANLTLELMQYHSPAVRNRIQRYQVNDVGGVRHIALKVDDIELAFEHIKSIQEVELINSSDEYRPFKISNISSDEFRFYDIEFETDRKEKQKVCDIVAGIRYFYFVDPYGVQWEFEQGHTDLGT